MSTETLQFDAFLKTIPVELAQKDGLKKSYTLKELTGEQRDTYLNDMNTRFKFDAKGQAQGVTDFRGLHSSLLLVSMIDESTQEPITNEELKVLPSTTMSGLFEAASKLSALDQKAEDEAKND